MLERDLKTKVVFALALGAKGIVIESIGAGSPGNLDKEIGEILKNGAPSWCRARESAKGA